MDTDIHSHQLPTGLRAGFALIVLAIGVGLIYYGRDFFLPVVAAMMLTFLLDTPMRALSKLKLPDFLSSFLLVLGLTAAAGGVLYQASESAEEWLDRAPEVAQSIERSTEPLRRTADNLSDMLTNIEQMADPAAGEKDAEPVAVQGASVQSKVVKGIGSAVVTLTLTLLLLFFCLATGGQFMQRLIRLPRHRPNRARLIRVLKAVQEQLSNYLFTITCMNALLGVAAAGMLWMFGVEEFWVLGLLAALTNYIPYFGSIVTIAAITYVNSFTAQTPIELVLPAMCFMLLNGIEALIITPALLGLRLRLNPVFILLSILFWGAVWGIGGMFLAVPILATIKVALDNWDDESNRFGTLLG